jgi:hypothetical protein
MRWTDGQTNGKIKSFLFCVSQLITDKKVKGPLLILTKTFTSHKISLRKN